MAGIDMETGGRSRALNKEINMIPFIDFLLVTVAFLLITAVWVTFSRVEATAKVPGPPDIDVPWQPERVLHVHSKAGEFALIWKHGATTIAETRVPKEADRGDATKYDGLAKAIEEQWNQHGEHRDAADRQPDLCVMHTDDTSPFREVIRAIDAVYGTQRDRIMASGEREKMAAFRVAFAAK